MNSVLLSIIVPVYNSEKSIVKCINSIVQNISDFTYEVIIINDGSTDNTILKINKLKEEYPDILLFNNSNHGVSYSRNFGISKSHGKWLAFVDSDDEVTSIFFQSFFQKQNNIENFDLFFGNVERINLDGTRFVEYNHPEMLCSVKEAITDYGLLKTGDIHAKIFKRSILLKKNIQFDCDISYGEDRLFIDQYFLNCTKIYLCNLICYKYIRNSLGLSYKLFSIDSEIKWLFQQSKVLYEMSEKFQISFEKTRLVGLTFRVFDLVPSNFNFKKFKYFLKNMPASAKNNWEADLKVKYKKISFVLPITKFLGPHSVYFLLKLSFFKNKIKG